MTQKKVPTYLAKAMNECGVPQRQIGESFGVSQSTVSRRMNENNK